MKIVNAKIEESMKKLKLLRSGLRMREAPLAQFFLFNLPNLYMDLIPQ